MQWWKRNNLRLMQNNLMETDADLDVDRLITNLKDLSVNTLMLNTGGIVAFYPTELEYQWRSPHLRGDLIGEAVRKCHDNGMRFIARFDFSKADRSVYEKKPEWFFTSADGRCIEYNGTVLTCVNGEYQRRYSLEILSEAIKRYPIDGVFFNMFGYQTRDYSGNYFGLCHCEGCQRAFREMFGREIPAAEDPADPAYQDYIKFRHITVRQMLERIHAHVKALNPNIAISTYDEYMVDIVRKESNTELTRPLPFWLHSGSENVKSLEDSWPDKLVSNCCINAVGLDYRFMGVSKHQVAARLYENIASGSGLDFCIIGNFERYPDNDNLDTVRRIFDFHKKNEQYFGNLQSLACIALVKPGRFEDKETQQEYLGLFKMLKEAHLLFDVAHQENLPAVLNARQYGLILIPGIHAFDEESLQALQAAHAGSAALLATQRSFCGNEDFRKAQFGILTAEPVAQTRSSYLQVESGDVFASFPQDKWVFVYNGFDALTVEPDVLGLLPYLSVGQYGPPEKCGGHAPTGLFGATVRQGGSAPAAFLPWEPGRLYLLHGYDEHKRIVLDMAAHLLAGDEPMETDAPPAVEVFYDQCPEGQYLLQLLNLSGFNGTTFHAPLPVYGITVLVRGLPATTRCTSLTGSAFTSEPCAEGIRVRIDRLEQYEAILLQ